VEPAPEIVAAVLAGVLAAVEPVVFVLEPQAARRSDKAATPRAVAAVLCNVITAESPSGLGSRIEVGRAWHELQGVPRPDDAKPRVLVGESVRVKIS
jgi:hypothetical protein